MMRVKVVGHNTWYRAEWVTQAEADAVGVSSANMRICSERLANLPGCDGWTYGYLWSSGRPPGRSVKVPGSSERGVRSKFGYDDPAGPLDVYLVR